MAGIQSGGAEVERKQRTLERESEGSIKEANSDNAREEQKCQVCNNDGQ